MNSAMRLRFVGRRGRNNVWSEERDSHETRRSRRKVWRMEGGRGGGEGIDGLTGGLFRCPGLRDGSLLNLNKKATDMLRRRQGTLNDVFEGGCA